MKGVVVGATTLFETVVARKYCVCLAALFGAAAAQRH